MRIAKSRISKEIAKNYGLPYTVAREIVADVFTIIENAVFSGNDVFIANFGTFSAVRRKPKKARNISKNEEIDIPERWTPVFKPSDSFKYLGEIGEDKK